MDTRRIIPLVKRVKCFVKDPRILGSSSTIRFLNQHSKDSNCNANENNDFKCLLPYSTDGKSTQTFMHRIINKICGYLEDSNDRTSTVVDFKNPEQLAELVDLEIKRSGDTLEQMELHADQILKYSVKGAHPRFFNQLWSGIDPIVLCGDWLSSTTNTPMLTYEIAPIQLLIEQQVLSTMKSLTGFTNGDGLFLPGGSMCNGMAIHLARYKHCPDIKKTGLSGFKSLIIYVSEECHYSFIKWASLLGIGSDNVVKIKTDDLTGKMRMDDLTNQIEASLKKGYQPLMVVATAGTTVGGAYDPMNEIADICAHHKLWFHVDGAWGGSALMSEKYKHLMVGCDRADSMTWDPHKMIGITATMFFCSCQR
eukprot:TCONS_00032061-protein